MALCKTRNIQLRLRDDRLPTAGVKREIFRIFANVYGLGGNFLGTVIMMDDGGSWLLVQGFLSILIKMLYKQCHLLIKVIYYLVPRCQVTLVTSPRKSMFVALKQHISGTI